MNETVAIDVYQQKLNEAKRLFDIHNFLRKPTYNDTRIVYQDFLDRLAEMGGGSNELLSHITAEDLQEKCKLPVLIARRLAEIFSGEDPEELRRGRH